MKWTTYHLLPPYTDLFYIFKIKFFLHAIRIIIQNPVLSHATLELGAQFIKSVKSTTARSYQLLPSSKYSVMDSVIVATNILMRDYLGDE